MIWYGHKGSTQIQLEMLYYQYADVRHVILNCAQTVHYMLQFVFWVDLVFLVIPKQIGVESCWLVGCCSQLLCQLHSQSEGFEIPETELPMMVLCVLSLCCACNGLLL